MWLDFFKACVALAWMYFVVRPVRLQLVKMTPADAAIAKRKFLIGMIFTALIGGLTLGWRLLSK
jgi:hypothetical protein